MPSRTNEQRLWPVSFRPVRGELLYSWMARIAAVYGMLPQELLPEDPQADPLRTMIQEVNPAVLKALAAHTGCSGDAIAKHTLVGAIPHLPSDLVVEPLPLPRLRACILGDAFSSSLPTVSF